MQVDWANWRPKEFATLLFVVRNGEILLMRKKRGLGAGKINGPGGRIEAGESSLDAAVRETREELGIVPISPNCAESFTSSLLMGIASIAAFSSRWTVSERPLRQQKQFHVDAPARNSV